MSDTYDIPFDKLNLKGYSEESLKQIKLWRESSFSFIEQEDFRKHPVTVKLAKVAKDEIERIENILKNQEDISEFERKSLFKEKKTHQFYLDLFTKDVSSDLEYINNLITDEIKNNQ